MPVSFSKASLASSEIENESWVSTVTVSPVVFAWSTAEHAAIVAVSVAPSATTKRLFVFIFPPMCSGGPGRTRGELDFLRRC